MTPEHSPERKLAEKIRYLHSKGLLPDISDIECAMIYVALRGKIEDSAMTDKEA